MRIKRTNNKKNNERRDIVIKITNKQWNEKLKSFTRIIDFYSCYFSFVFSIIGRGKVRGRVKGLVAVEEDDSKQPNFWRRTRKQRKFGQETADIPWENSNSIEW